MADRSLAFALAYLGWAQWLRRSCAGLGRDGFSEMIDKARRRGVISEDMAGHLARRFA